MKRHSQNLYLSQNGIYYFRVVVPKDVRPIIGSTEIKRSLATRDYLAARLEVDLHRAYFARYFVQLNSGMDNNNKLGTLVNYVADGKLRSVGREEARSRLEELYLLKHIRAHAGEVLADSLNADITATGKPLLSTDELLPVAKIESEILSLEAAVTAMIHIGELFSKLDQALGAPATEQVVEKRQTPTGISSSTPAKSLNGYTYTLSDLVADYARSQVKENKWSAATKEKTTAKLNLLTEILGDVALDQIDRSSARTVQGILQKLPPNKHKDKTLEGRDIHQIANMTHSKCLSPKTVNNHIDQYKALFRWAIIEDKYSSRNPFENMRIKDVVRDDQRREDFTTGDLERIFAHNVFTNYGNDRHDCPSRYWGTLIGVTTGARVNEIMCLELKNVVFEGIPHFHITADLTANSVQPKASRMNTRFAKCRSTPNFWSWAFESTWKHKDVKEKSFCFRKRERAKYGQEISWEHGSTRR